MLGDGEAEIALMEQKWMEHEDPAGFALDVPAGWETRTEGGRIDVTGTGMERATIWPLKIEGQLDSNRARDVLLSLSQQFSPGQRWNVPKSGWQFGADCVRAVGLDESASREVTALWWANTWEGAAGFFYALAAPPHRFQSLEPAFARILASFRVTPAAATGAASGASSALEFVSWTDPTEMAFSLEVPAGWRVTGGIVRRPTFPLSEAVISSPDGMVVVRLGDVNFASKFIQPNQTLMNNGHTEGQFTSDGTFIMRYMSGMDFASYYIQTTMGRNSQGFQWLNGIDRPDYVQNLAWYAHALRYAYHSAGEVTYSYQFDGQACVGYQFAETAVTHHSELASMWNLQSLLGFVAPADRAAQADTVLQRAQSSNRHNPEWLMREVQMNRQLGDDFRRYREHSANLWQQTQAARMASWDRISEQRGDLLRGVTQVKDPQTGETFKVQSGSNYYWFDPTREVIAGTDIPSKPTWDFREMIETYH